MTDLHCVVCHKPLAGGLDTYGDVGQELCLEHWLELCRASEAVERTWYGLAPHHHDLTVTGSIIGSTVYDPLPAQKTEGGEYEIEPGLYFWPDPEAPRGGMWRDTRLPKRIPPMAILPEFKR